MKEKKKEMQKQVLTLLGILIFAFVNVFIFDNKMGAGFSAFSTITLMTIGLLSKLPVCEFWLLFPISSMW